MSPLLERGDVIPVAAPTRLAEREGIAVRKAIEAVASSDRWVGGPIVSEFERDFATFTKSAHVVGVGNGTDALCFAFLALDLPAGTGVLVAANEGGYAAVALRMAGLEPVVMDVDQMTMAPTVETAQAALARFGGTVTGIVITHLHGDPVPLEDLATWCQQVGLMMVEDCAQAHGARSTGSIGDAATYSFYPTKNLGAIGDAGAMTFRDSKCADRARSLREYGWGARYRIDLPGGRNSRLDPIQAAVLSARLPFLEERNGRRRAIQAGYRAALSNGPDRIAGDAETSVAHHAVVISARRDELAQFLLEDGIETAIHYPHLVQEMPGLGLSDVATPVAAALRDQVLSIPCFPEMTDEEVVRVQETLVRWRDRTSVANG